LIFCSLTSNFEKKFIKKIDLAERHRSTHCICGVELFEQKWLVNVRGNFPENKCTLNHSTIANRFRKREAGALFADTISTRTFSISL